MQHRVTRREHMWERSMKKLSLVCMLLFPITVLGEQASVDDGEVRVPLHMYTTMLKATQKGPRPAPVDHAIGGSDVNVKVTEQDDRVTAKVSVRLKVQTFEDEWTLVPVLPPGAALTKVTVSGKAVQLVQGPDGLSWSTNKAGTVEMQLAYGLNAHRSDAGFVLPVPVPRAAATQVRVEIPGRRLDLAVVPSADLETTEVAKTDVTLATASVPTTSSILVTWRAPSKRPYVLSRATYIGTLKDKALVWRAGYDVEAFSGELITLPLMPNNITLSDIHVDGKPATVLNEKGRFATLIKGRGNHEVEVRFQTPVLKQKGPPQATVQIPRVPVSRFQLSLPGRKELKVSPHANVVNKEVDGRTSSTVFVPLSEQVVFSWVDAVPEDLKARVRANASVYHAVHAEEGVLHVQGIVAYEISHGETNTLALTLPPEVQVNRISAPSGGVSDWAVEPMQSGRKKISVFLDRAVKGDFILEVFYEHLLGSSTRMEQPVAVPLMRAVDVHRQRGMLALLAGQDLALEPTDEEQVSRVGENQLPAFVRNRLEMTIAHTYKYIDRAAQLMVKAVAPERKQGIFDAQVDTLISIGEVTLKGSATVQIDVKSGSIMELRLRLPPNVNVLGVTGPSLRTHQVHQDDKAPYIDLAFTQEMEGQFRIEVNYERNMVDSEAEAPVPTISVAEAEVEHGRIAVEALTAVEVQPGVAEQLSNVDINELPRQLVLKTTNPILLSYKYVHAQPPFRLTLKITRHEEIDVQTAAIEQAQYRTLYTPDGLAVTTARFTVRNSRRQFLRLELPQGWDVWSAFVDGKPEKPAHTTNGAANGSKAVLLKMINSVNGFPVELVYATRLQKMGFSGSIADNLPRPDMVVTRSRWDVFLPTRFHYRRPTSTMNMVVAGRWTNSLQAVTDMGKAAEDARAHMGQPLRIQVPTEGIHYAFEKLYANQAEEDASFSIRYVAAQGNQLGLWLTLAGVILVWAGIIGLASHRVKLSRTAATGMIVLGTALLAGSLAYLGTNPMPASALALLVAALLGLVLVVQRLLAWRQRRTGSPTATTPSA